MITFICGKKQPFVKEFNLPTMLEVLHHPIVTNKASTLKENEDFSLYKTTINNNIETVDSAVYGRIINGVFTNLHSPLNQQ